MTLPPDDRDPRHPEDRPDFDRSNERSGFGRPRFGTPRSGGGGESRDPDEAYDEPVYDDEREDEFAEGAYDDEEYTDEDFEDDEYLDEDESYAPVASARAERDDPSMFAPVVFDDDEPRRPFLPRRGGEGEGAGRGRGGGRTAGTGWYQSDANLYKVLGVIAVLGVVILALVLPFSPISVLDGGDDAPISTRRLDEIPPLPEGLVALSDAYEITIREGLEGPLGVGIELKEPIDARANLAYYSWDGSEWTRLSSVTLDEDGDSVTGSIPAQSASIAVLQRTALAHNMAMIVGAGETPAPDGLASASLVTVMAATLEADGIVEVEDGGLDAAKQVAGERPVLLGITGDAGLTGVIADTETHITEVREAVQSQDAAGVYLEYTGVTDPAGFTALVTALADALHEEGRQIIVGVPAMDEGYDWPGMAAVADGLWVQAPLNPAEYHSTVEVLLSERGVTETSKVSVVLDRRSAIQSEGEPATPLTLVEALTIASTIDFNVEAIGPGDPVTLRTAYLGESADGQLHWDDEVQAVTFTFADEDGEATIWFQNEYSFGFALQAASRGGFGGVAVRSASDGGANPDVWEPVAQFTETGSVALLKPFGPYLTPCWQAPEGAIEGQPECWTAETDTTAVVWRAPEETGNYTVRLVVSEGTMFVGQEVVLNVGDTPDDEGDADDADAEETEEPTETPTEEPTEVPTETPTPAEEPTEEPTEAPTEEPTETPTETPTEAPAGEDD